MTREIALVDAESVLNLEQKTLAGGNFAVAIPIFLMYRQLGLSDTHLGMILLYTGVNISLAVWLLKGFIDEIPLEYEEAALWTALADACRHRKQ